MAELELGFCTYFHSLGLAIFPEHCWQLPWERQTPLTSESRITRWMLTSDSSGRSSSVQAHNWGIQNRSGLYSLIPGLVVIHTCGGMPDNLVLSQWLFVLFFVSVTGPCRNHPQVFWDGFQVADVSVCELKSHCFSPDHPLASLLKQKLISLLFFCQSWLLHCSVFKSPPLLHRAVKCLHLFKMGVFYHLFPTISSGERRGWSDPGSFLKTVCSLSFLRLRMNNSFRNAFGDVVALGSLIALWPSPKNYFCSVSKGDLFQVIYIKLQFNTTFK